jgi:hypothetical protein
VGITRDGVEEPIEVQHGSYFGGPGPPGVLAPEGVGIGAVNISGGNGRSVWSGSRVYAILRIGLPGAGSVEIPGSTIDTICGVSVSAFGITAAR